MNEDAEVPLLAFFLAKRSVIFIQLVRGLSESMDSSES